MRSGANGKAVWKTELDDTNLDSSLAMQWYLYPHVFFDSGRPAAQDIQSHGSPHDRRRVDNRPAAKDRARRPGLPGVPHLLNEHEAVIACGRSLVRLNVSNGNIKRIDDLPGRHWTPIRLANVNDDPMPEVVCVVTSEPTDAGGIRSVAPSASAYQLLVWSCQQNEVLWSTALESWLPQPMLPQTLQADWPVLDDLDGDGRAEVIVPTKSPSRGSAPAAWGELSVLSGATGRTRWSRRVFTKDQQVDFFASGPDIDGDGSREVFAAVLAGKRLELFVDCLSGKDGVTIWRGRHRLTHHELSQDNLVIRPLSWWECGLDGWPQLIVPLGGEEVTSQVVVFSAGSGKVSHVAHGVHHFEMSDVDGDGYDELTTLRRHNRGVDVTCHQGGVIRRFCFTSKNVGTSFGREWTSVGDIDGDGYHDLARAIDGGRMQAVSLRTGNLLWDRVVFASAGFSYQHMIELDEPVDLDADGRSDLLLQVDGSRCVAVSGVDGARLWTLEGISTDQVRVENIDHDVSPELIVLGSDTVVAPDPFVDAYQCLSVIDGNSGTLQWRYNAEIPMEGPEGVAPVLVHDNAICLLSRGEQLNVTNLVKVDGASGDVIFALPLGGMLASQDPFEDTRPTIHLVDFDGDGRSEVAVNTSRTTPSGASRCVLVIDAEQGRVLSEFVQEDGLGVPKPFRYAHETQLVWPVASTGIEPVISSGKDVLGALAAEPTAAVYPCDVDGDQIDELVVFEDNQVSVRRLSAIEDPVWIRTVLPFHPFGNPRRLVQARSETHESTAEISCYFPQRRERMALNAQTGRTLYRLMDVGPDVIPTAFPTAPCAIVDHEPTTIVKQAVPFDPQDLANLRETLDLKEPGPDLRAARPLPWIWWKYQFGPEGPWPPLHSVVVLTMGVVVVPMGYVGWLVGRRQWSLRMFLLAPAVVSGVVFCFIWGLDMRVTTDFVERIEIALLAFPGALVFLAGCGLAWRRRWKSLLAIVLVSVLISFGIGVGWTLHDTRALMLAEEYYSWSDWYIVLAFGPYAVGCSLLAAAPFYFAARWLARYVQSSRTL